MKSVLILGSNSDVGKACAYRFAQDGFNIMLASRNVDDSQKRLASDISIRYNVEVTPAYFNALEFSEHQKFYASLLVEPDVVISAFGMLGNQDQAIKNNAHAFEIINTNFLGNVSILNVIAEAMTAKGSGTIICISSVAGERGRQSNYIYGSSKAGLTTYLSGLRNRMTKKNVHVCTVIPGFIKSKMINGMNPPKVLTASPNDVAKAIWLGYVKKKNVVYSLALWYPVMMVIRNIPENLFKRLNL